MEKLIVFQSVGALAYNQPRKGVEEVVKNAMIFEAAVHDLVVSTIYISHIFNIKLEIFQTRLWSENGLVITQTEIDRTMYVNLNQRVSNSRFLIKNTQAII